MAIRRQGKTGEENILPSGETVLLAGDSLLLLGPTSALDALAAGTLPSDEALAHRGID
jgi:Trk K+ transport system NAD-binding subunit